MPDAAEDVDRAAWVLLRLKRDLSAMEGRAIDPELHAAVDLLLAVLCSDAASWRTVRIALWVAYLAGRVVGRRSRQS